MRRGCVPQDASPPASRIILSRSCLLVDASRSHGEERSEAIMWRDLVRSVGEMGCLSRREGREGKVSGWGGGGIGVIGESCGGEGDKGGEGICSWRNGRRDLGSKTVTGWWSEEYWWKGMLGHEMSKRVWGEGSVSKDCEMSISSIMEGGELQELGVCVRLCPIVAFIGRRLHEER